MVELRAVRARPKTSISKKQGQGKGKQGAEVEDVADYSSGPLSLRMICELLPCKESFPSTAGPRYLTDKFVQ
jgi:hypothetical protein